MNLYRETVHTVACRKHIDIFRCFHNICIILTFAFSEFCAIRDVLDFRIMVLDSIVYRISVRSGKNPNRISDKILILVVALGEYFTTFYPFYSPLFQYDKHKYLWHRRWRAIAGSRLHHENIFFHVSQFLNALEKTNKILILF